MSYRFTKTINGQATGTNNEDALTEINWCMMGNRRSVKTMTASNGVYLIEYRNGTTVRYERHEGEAQPEPVAEQPKPMSTFLKKPTGDLPLTAKGNVVATIKGKTYAVRPSYRQAGWPGQDGVTAYFTEYFSVRDGREFGPIRTAMSNGKPGTVGRALWDLVAGL